MYVRPCFNLLVTRDPPLEQYVNDFQRFQAGEDERHVTLAGFFFLNKQSRLVTTGVKNVKKKTI